MLWQKTRRFSHGLPEICYDEISDGFDYHIHTDTDTHTHGKHKKGG